MTACTPVKAGVQTLCRMTLGPGFRRGTLND
jgi:hypothetical protein